MPEAFSIGPLLVPTRPFGVLVLLVVAVWASGYIAHRLGLEKGWARKVAEGAAWAGLVGARAGYVVVNWRSFADAPWTVLYFWQPGYSAYSGIMLGVAYVFWRLNKRVLLERYRYLLTLAGGYASATLLIFATVFTMDVLRDPDKLGTGDLVPNFALQNLAGEKVNFSDLAGRAVILNFWATWCPPCRREMPLLDAVHKQYASRGVSIVGVDLSEPREIVQAFARKMAVSYPIWIDADAPGGGFDRTRDLYQRLGGVGLPTTFFIDTEGIIRRIHVGELNRAILENQAEELRPKS